MERRGRVRVRVRVRVRGLELELGLGLGLGLVERRVRVRVRVRVSGGDACHWPAAHTGIRACWGSGLFYCSSPLFAFVFA